MFLGIIVEKDGKSGAYRTADGQTVKHSRLSLWPIEPDIVNLRIHGIVKRKVKGKDEGPRKEATKGQKPPPADEIDDSVYDFGLIADHTNPANKKENRSTILKDQEREQAWGPVSDVLWLTDIKAELADSEMFLTPAGFPGLLHPTKLGTGSANRRAVGINAAKNAGFVVTPGGVGQFWHVFAFPGSSTASAGGRPSDKKWLGLRADVPFHHKNGSFQIGIGPDKVDETSGMKCKGYLTIDSTPEALSPNDFAKDTLSNHTEIAPGKAQKLRCYVKVPPPVTPVEKQPQPPSHPTPPTEPSTEPPMVPTKAASTPASNVVTMLPGEYSGFDMEIPIPAGLPADAWCEVEMPLALTVAYAKAQSSDLNFRTQTGKNCDSGGLSAPVNETKSINSSDGVHTNNYKVLRKVIPPSALLNKDFIFIGLNMMSTSTGPGLTMKNPTAKFTNGPGVQPGPPGGGVLF
jgi:hypothetical protein